MLVDSANFKLDDFAMPRRVPNAILSQKRQREILYRYGKSHLTAKIPPKLPPPVVPTFRQRVSRSDGSTFVQMTTNPKTSIRLTRDLTNSPLWTEAALAGRGSALDNDETGRVGRFRSRFGDYSDLAECVGSLAT